jgi:hypothetical protein
MSLNIEPPKKCRWLQTVRSADAATAHDSCRLAAWSSRRQRRENRRNRLPECGHGRWKGRITIAGNSFADFPAASLFVTIGFPARPLAIPCSAPWELPRKSLQSKAESERSDDRSQKFPASREIAACFAAAAYRPARGAPNRSSAVFNCASCAVPITFGLIGRSSSASRRGGGTAPLLPFGAKAPAALSAPDRSLS